jgi:hypothetical protein
MTDLNESPYEAECIYCDDYECQKSLVSTFDSARLGAVFGVFGVCSDCLDAYECEDAPWELAVTLGDINVDDEDLRPGFEDDYETS